MKEKRRCVGKSLGSDSSVSLKYDSTKEGINFSGSSVVQKQSGTLLLLIATSLCPPVLFRLF